MAFDIGSIFGTGGIIPGLGSLWQTDKSADMADHAMNVSSAEAAQSRDFQERMSNTSWQRGTADMMAAGINPMLAFMKGGASSPGGAQGSGYTGSASNPGEAYATGNVSSASAAKQRQETENLKAEETNIRNQARIQDATVDNLKAQAAQTAAQQGLTEEQEKKVMQEIENLGEELVNLRKTGEKIDQEALLTHARRFLTKEQTADVRVNRVLSLLDVNKAVNEAMAELSQFKKHVSPFLGDAGKVLGSASQIHDAFRRQRMNKYIIEGK